LTRARRYTPRIARRILSGDIHNRNAHGYGVGSIERSIDVARTHLDFFAFTGHAWWHDLEPWRAAARRTGARLRAARGDASRPVGT
jgi:hypothetical protein